jgi:hypothetical protein
MKKKKLLWPLLREPAQIRCNEHGGCNRQTPVHIVLQSVPGYLLRIGNPLFLSPIGTGNRMLSEFGDSSKAMRKRQ